jgi:hypothetical protein
MMKVNVVTVAEATARTVMRMDDDDDDDDTNKMISFYKDETMND